MSDKPWLAHYDDGVPHSIEYPNVNLVQMFEETVQKYPDSPCTFFKGATITYSEMNELTDKLAAGLAKMGITKGDRVGLFVLNTPQFVMSYFGVLKAGGIVVATNPLYTGREIVHQANDSGMEVMIVMSNFYEKVKSVQKDTKIHTLVVTNIKETLPPVMRVLFTLAREKKGGFRVTLRDNDVWLQDLIAQNTPAERPDIEIKPDDTAIFQYTGGTTGVSKGAVGSHRGVVANSYQIRSWMTDCNDGREVALLAIPLYHAYGMIAGMTFAIKAGASMVMVPDPRDTKDVLDNLQKYKATIYPGVPAMYNAINNHPDVISGKYDISSIKGCISGSAPLLRETKERFESLTGGVVFEGYGLSETPVATHCNPLQGVNKTGSIGMPLPDVEAKIVDLDDGETELPIGEIGEILIKGPQVMKGYHNMPTETANALRNDWLYTGDIAYMDEDGYFYIVDRKKELIKPGGFQVWPREVEEVLQGHPAVLEVGVAGIPDAHSGEAVKAWVVLKPGTSASEEELKAFCKENMAAYKIPKQIEYLSELPKTTVGKILRRELVRMHRENTE
jgi:long-chain acyl-CoA synthetase